MRIEYLNFFIAVVDYGSISKAANELFISPQGLSQAIQKLEQELEVPLFYREGSHLALTAAGEEAYEMAKSITTMAQSLQNSMANYRRHTEHANSNELHILSAPIINTTFLPKVMTQLRKRNPSLKIVVYEADPEEMFEKFEQTPGAILLLSMPELELEALLKDSPRALNFYELCRAPLMASVSSKSPLAKKSTINISEYHRHSLVVYGVEDRLLSHLDMDADLQQVVLQTSSLPMCRSMLSVETDGIGFTNAVVERYLKTASLTAVPLVPTTDMLFGYLVTPESRKNPVMEEFIHLVKNELREE